MSTQAPNSKKAPSPAPRTDENGLITQSRLKELVVYDWRSGEFINRTTRSPNARTGEIAGSIDKVHGYRKIRLDGKDYRAHRLVFLYVTGSWPKEQIDHIDGDKLNNRFENLREVSPQENGRNQGVRVNNTSGHVGVCWHKALNKWQAQIMVNGKDLYLGLFDDLEEAIAARKKAEREHNFHPGHGSRPASNTAYMREWKRKYYQRQREAQASEPASTIH